MGVCTNLSSFSSSSFCLTAFVPFVKGVRLPCLVTHLSRIATSLYRVTGRCPGNIALDAAFQVIQEQGFSLSEGRCRDILEVVAPMLHHPFAVYQNMAVFVVNAVKRFDVHGLPLRTPRKSIDMPHLIFRLELFAIVVVVGSFRIDHHLFAALFALK